MTPLPPCCPRPPGFHGPLPHESSTLVCTIDRSFPLMFIVQGDACPVAGVNWTQLTISLTNLGRLARFLAGLWALSMANYDNKAMEIVGNLWKSSWEVFLPPSARRPF